RGAGRWAAQRQRVLANLSNSLALSPLTSEGIVDVAEASSGDEAFRLFAEAQPDAVLLEVHIPEMGGLARPRTGRGHAGRRHTGHLALHRSPALACPPGYMPARYVSRQAICTRASVE